MEAFTGAVVYEKNSHEARHPASVTKIMTLLLIFDALSSKQISLDDTVTVSEYAAFTELGIGRAMWTYKALDFGLVGEHYAGVRKDLIALL